MKDAFGLLVTALLVCSLPAVASTGGAPLDRGAPPSPGLAPVGAVDDSWLTPSDGDVASGSGYVVIDASATIDADADRLESRYEAHRVAVRFDQADSDAQRRTIVREATETLESDVAQLHERERQAYRAYHAGEIDERRLAVELATVHATAVVLEGSIESLAGRAETVPDAPHDTLEALEARTATMQGPVRERVAHALGGEIEPTRVHVEADENGVVLATVGDGRFYREAYRADAHDPGGETRLASLGESEQRVSELYPEVFSAARWSYAEMGHGAHRAVGEYSQGTITVYLDRSTTDVYREHLELRPERVDVEPVGSQVEDGVRLNVEASAPGGPAVVSLARADDGAPVSGRVAVDGRELGETDDEGRFWIVLSDEETRITASVDSTTVELTVDGSALSRSDRPADG